MALTIYAVRNPKFGRTFQLTALIALALATRPGATQTTQNPKADIVDVVRFLPDSPAAALLVLDQGQVIIRHAQGKLQMHELSKCDPRSNFRLASITKQFTASAVLLLAEREQLTLDATIDTFFSGAPDPWSRITVRQLLTHTSGIVAYETLIPEPIITAKQLTDADALKMLLAHPTLYSEPGAEFRYSNSGYVLLGLIVEKVSGISFQQFLHDNLFQPAGMLDTVLFVSGSNQVTNRVYGHRRKREGTFKVDDQSLTSALRGDGGVYSSLDDLQKWIATIMDRKLLSPESYELLFGRLVKTDRGESHYGCGWFIDEYRGEKRIYHNGGTRGFALTLRMFPDRKAAVVLLLNIEDADGMQAAADKITDALLFRLAK